MDIVIELLKAAFLGIVEGITEWLPISSTGHMIIVDEFLKLNVSDAFLKLFLVVIQLGAIMAVIVLYFHKLNPFSPRKNSHERKQTLSLWGKVLVGTIPAAIVGVLFDDWVNSHLYNYVVVAIALIVYGIAFIIIERINRHKAGELLTLHGSPEVSSSHSLSTDEYRPRHSTSNIKHAAHADTLNISQDSSVSPSLQEDTSELYAKVITLDEIGYRRAFFIGCFQCLAIIPGTSRSGSTILGSMILGLSRTVAAEFAFFLAIPIMFGWSLVKVIKFGFSYTGLEIALLLTGCIVSFVVSILAIKFLIGYIKKNDFTVFGWYRIILGIVIIALFLFTNNPF